MNKSTSLIQVKDLSAFYKTNDYKKSLKNGLNLNVLQNVNFTLEGGTLICLCGLNGSGKSTLLSILTGLAPASLNFTTEPIIQTEKLSTPVTISSLSRKQCAQNISFMAQNENSIWDFTVFDVVLSGRFCYTKNGNYSEEDKQIAYDVLKEMQLEQFSDRTVHTLSGGEFQKVRIARSLAQTPSFIILDEPTSSLDFVYEHTFIELLKQKAIEKNIGILISIHDINLAAKFCDKILLLPKNKDSIFGEPDKVLSIENLNTTFGASFVCKETNSFQLLQ